jgi:hypothetical protein
VLVGTAAGARKGLLVRGGDILEATSQVRRMTTFQAHCAVCYDFSRRGLNARTGDARTEAAADIMTAWSHCG